MILLNETEFREILQKKEKLFYPALKQKLSIIQFLWEDSDNVISKKFILDSINRINSVS